MIKNRVVHQADQPLEPVGTLTSTMVCMGWNGLSDWCSLMIRRSPSLLTRMRKRINGSVLCVYIHLKTCMLTIFFISLPAVRLEVLRALVGHIPPHPLWAELLWQRQEEMSKRTTAVAQPQVRPQSSQPPFRSRRETLTVE